LAEEVIARTAAAVAPGDACLPAAGGAVAALGVVNFSEEEVIARTAAAVAPGEIWRTAGAGGAEAAAEEEEGVVACR
jgi:hypothetical protein